MGAPLMRRLVVVLAVGVCLLAPAGEVLGQDAGAKIRLRLKKGKQLFDELEYRRAIRILRPVTTASEATRAQRLQAHEVIGLSYLTLGNRKRARAAFEDLLTIDPNYRLKNDTGSPKIRRFFRRVKKSFVPNAGTGSVDLEHAAPASALGARRVEIELLVGKGAANVKEVSLWYRRRGLLRYEKRPFIRFGKRGDRDRWRARFTAPPTRQRSAVEYYVEARDIGGRVIGRIAGPVAPLAIVLTRGTAGKIPWYRRWYVIAGGAAALGIGGALLINATSGSQNGSLDPGSVVLTP